MTRLKRDNPQTSELDALEEEVLRLEMENHDLRQKAHKHEFDRYKLREIQKIARGGSWELNHLTYDLRISAELALVLFNSPKEITDFSWEMFIKLIPAGEYKEVERELQETLVKSGKTVVCEHNLTVPSGRTFYIRHHCRTFYNIIGQPMTTVGLILDITDEHEHSIDLEQLSITDELTQLYNRRRINAILAESLDAYHRYHMGVSVIMIDLDHFKRINDNFGHQVGDEVLVKVAKTIKDHIRSVDKAGRWGGEELLVICPNTSLENAAELAEKLRKTLMAMPRLSPGMDAVTASMGVAQILPGESLDDLMERVDTALYEAKNNGRNQVKIA